MRTALFRIAHALQFRQDQFPDGGRPVKFHKFGLRIDINVGNSADVGQAFPDRIGAAAALQIVNFNGMHLHFYAHVNFLPAAQRSSIATVHCEHILKSEYVDWQTMQARSKANICGQLA